MEEYEASSDLSRNAELMLPRDDGCVLLAEKAIVKASAGHVLVDEATIFRTGTLK